MTLQIKGEEQKISTRNQHITTDQKEKSTGRIRTHRILDRPAVGTLCLIMGGIVSWIIISGIISSFTEETVIYDLARAAYGVLLVGVYRFWFRGEYKGCISFEFLRDRSIMLPAVIFIGADLLYVALGYICCGFVRPGINAFALSLGAAFYEEAICRVLPISNVMRSCRKWNIYYPALIYPAVGFGMAHFSNLRHGQSVAETLIQVAFATVFGLFSGAIYLRTGSIVLPVILHFTHDLLVEMTLESDSVVFLTDYVGTAALTLVMAALTVWLLKDQKSDIKKTWDAIWREHEGKMML